MEQVTLSTGVTVGIRKVSPFTLDAVRRHYPAPKPPLVDVAYGDKTTKEPNESDPDYLAALEQHQLLVSTKITDAMFQLGLDVDVDAAALAAFREEMAALEITISGNDKQVYIRHVAIGTKDDMDLISRAITRTTMPTEEAVQEHLDTFSGDVPGAQRDGDRAATVGGSL